MEKGQSIFDNWDILNAALYSAELQEAAKDEPRFKMEIEADLIDSYNLIANFKGDYPQLQATEDKHALEQVAAFSGVDGEGAASAVIDDADESDNERSASLDPLLNARLLTPPDLSYMDKDIADAKRRQAAARSAQPVVPTGSVAATRNEARRQTNKASSRVRRDLSRQRKAMQRRNEKLEAAGVLGSRGLGPRVSPVLTKDRVLGKPPAFSPYRQKSKLVKTRQRPFVVAGSKVKRQEFFTKEQQKKYEKLCKVYKVYRVKPGRIMEPKRHLRPLDTDMGGSAFAAGPAHTFGNASVWSTLKLGETVRPAHLRDNAIDAIADIRSVLSEIDGIVELDEKLGAFSSAKELYDQYIEYKMLDLDDDDTKKFRAEMQERIEAILNSMLPPPRYDGRPPMTPVTAPAAAPREPVSLADRIVAPLTRRVPLSPMTPVTAPAAVPGERVSLAERIVPPLNRRVPEPTASRHSLFCLPLPPLPERTEPETGRTDNSGGADDAPRPRNPGT
ncbi:MAG: hypothetical protein P1U34_11040 [Coxiellaceae bacterium]|nr:hypothetical protein [Coxiellaceae bacterium]